MISCISATQKIMQYIENFTEELSGAADKKTLMKIYNNCTDEPFSFLYVKLIAKSIHDMFFCNLRQKVVGGSTVALASIPGCVCLLACLLSVARRLEIYLNNY